MVFRGLVSETKGKTAGLRPGPQLAGTLGHWALWKISAYMASFKTKPFGEFAFLVFGSLALVFCLDLGVGWLFSFLVLLLFCFVERVALCIVLNSLCRPG